MKQAQDEVAQGTECLSSFTCATGIFTPDSVSFVVRAVFNFPVTPPVLVKGFGRGGGAGNSVFGFLEANFPGIFVYSSTDAANKLLGSREAIAQLRLSRARYLPEPKLSTPHLAIFKGRILFAARQ